MRRPRLLAYYMAAEMLNDAAGVRATGASSAIGHGGTLVYVRAAVQIHPLKAARCANPVRSSSVKASGNTMRGVELPGECGKCGAPAPDGSARCERCARSAAKHSRKKAKNARSRQLYAQRRARRLCSDCGAPSQGAARCPPCARRSWARSGEYRGLPILPPQFTVIEIATGADHGTWQNLAEVAACLAFARLSPGEVEILTDM